MPRLGLRRLILLVCVAGGLGLGGLLALTSATYYGQGVSNARIDSPVKFEFDYHADRSCAYEDVVYVFFDRSGNRVGRFADTTMDAVVAGKDYHYIITAARPDMTIDSRAVRFEATASCNG